MVNRYIDQYQPKTKVIDGKERDRLIEEFAPIIKQIAYRIAVRLPSHIEIDDLISVGVIGLIDAIEKFDPTKETKLKTYAEIRIRGAIFDELRALDWVPRTVRQKATELSDVYFKLEQALGRPATDEEAAKELGISIADFHNLLRDASGIPLISLEDLGGRSSDGDKRDILECLAGTKDNDPQTLTRISEIKELVANAIDQLPEKERLLVSLYYYEELTMKEIGAVLGITESRVSQIHTKSVLRLRAKLKRFIED